MEEMNENRNVDLRWRLEKKRSCKSLALLRWKGDVPWKIQLARSYPIRHRQFKTKQK